MTELKNRGVQDVFVACVDGLKGFPDAIEAVFPRAQVQLCLVHLTRYNMNFASCKERKFIARDLRTIYQASTVEAAQLALDEFRSKWDHRYPMIGQSWARH